MPLRPLQRLVPPALKAGLGLSLAVGLLMPVDATAAAVTPAVLSSEVGASPAIDAGPVEQLTTETSTTVREEDGTYTTTMNATPVNYQDTGGEWQEIDTTLEDASGETFAARSDENVVVAKMPADASESPLRVADGGRWVTVQMHGLDGEPVIEGSTATYRDADGAEDAAEVSYEVIPGGVKEDIVLDRVPEGPVTYRYDVDASAGLDATLTDGGDVEFRNAAGDVAFVMPRGNMIDSAAPEPAFSWDVDYGLLPVAGGGWRLTVTPDVDWLRAPERVFPVRVDPTVVQGERGRIAACTITNANNSSNCSPDFLKAGRNANGYWRALLKFDISDIPADATINGGNNSHLQLWQRNDLSPNTNAGTYAIWRAGYPWNGNANWSHSGYYPWAGGNTNGRVSDQATIGAVRGNNGIRTFWNMGSVVQQWHQNPASNLGLVVVQESAENNILFFSSGFSTGDYVPRLQVNYTLPDRSPQFAGSLGVQPCSSCAAGGIVTTTTTPTLSALFTDADTALLNHTFEVRRFGSTTNLLPPHPPVSRAQGQTASWQVPASKLMSGLTYEYRAYVEDGATSPVYSPWTQFTVSTAAEPLTPGAEVEDWPEVPTVDLPPTPVDADPADSIDDLASLAPLLSPVKTRSSAMPSADWSPNEVVNAAPVVTSPVQLVGLAAASAPASMSSIDGVVINEVESDGDPASGDWIELHNLTDDAIDLGGAILSDSDNSHAFVIPDGEVVLAQGQAAYRVDGSFDLDATDSARLFPPGDVGLSELVDSFSWTEHAPETWGRYPDGVGDFVATTESTATSPNETPNGTPGGPAAEAESVVLVDVDPVAPTEPQTPPDTFMISLEPGLPEGVTEQSATPAQRKVAAAAAEAVTAEGVGTRVDYDTLGATYGGYWTDRLEVMAYPECYLTTPEEPGCSDGVVVPSVNNVKERWLDFTAAPLEAEVPVTGSVPTLGSCFTPATSEAETADLWESDGSTDPAAEPAEVTTDGEMPADPSVTPPETGVDPSATGSDEDLDADGNGLVDQEETGPPVDVEDPNEDPVIDLSDPTAADAPAPGPKGGYGITSASACNGRVVYAAKAAAGDYAQPDASTVNPSGSWQVGVGTGEFSYSYPFALPAGMGDETPGLELSYSSGAVDGLTSPTNGQGSAAGLGWTLEPGYISRSYASCMDDGEKNVGDLCWNSKPGELVNDLTITLNGQSSRLVRHGNSSKWRLEDDPGWDVDYLEGPETGRNPDNNDERFLIRTPDGSSYYFGYENDSNSVWTVPVFGNDAGEPCHKAAKAQSFCDQAWRWNLEKVVSPNGNVVRYFYDTETNHYQRWGSSAAANRADYDRAGRLATILYGYPKAGPAAGEARSRVEVGSVLRCTNNVRPGNTAGCVDNNSARNNNRIWPDTPGDLICGPSGACNDYSPSFFSTFRYDKIVTSVRAGASGTWKNVDRYDLVYKFPDPDKGANGNGQQVNGKEQPNLWLDAIQHKGFTESGTATSAPDVEFNGVALKNRVTPGGGRKFMKFRVDMVRNELGGRTKVYYGHASDANGASRGCTPADVKDKEPGEVNGECFAQQWAAPGDKPHWEWFHKYVVTRVWLRDDALGIGWQPTTKSHLGKSRVYDYEYNGNPGWRFSNTLNTPFKKRSWNDWRGYANTWIKTRNVVGNEPQGKALSIRIVKRYRGLSNDRRPNGNPEPRYLDTDERPANDAALRLEDLRRFSGRIAEEKTLDSTGKWLTRTYHGYGADVTADPTSGSRAFRVTENLTRTATPIADGQPKVHTVRRSYNAGSGVLGGALTEVRDYGWGTTAQTCTTTSWAGNASGWVRGPREVKVRENGCDTDDKTVSKTTTYYDGYTDWTILRGNPTMVETGISGTESMLTGSTYDDYGRVTSSYDPRGRTTTTQYNKDLNTTTGVNDRIQRVTTTLPTAGGVDLATTTDHELTRGLVTQARDANNGVSKTTYDGLGRVTSSLSPAANAAGHGDSVTYDYAVSGTRPAKVTTHVRRTTTGGTRVNDDSFAFLDGWGRTVETQTAHPTLAGARIVSSTSYDDQGLPAISVPTAWGNREPGSVANADPTSKARRTETTYDALGRTTAVREIGLDNNSKYTVDTDYLGDRVLTLPGVGGNTMTHLDAWGRSTEVKQLALGGALAHSARYTYSGTGQLRTIKSKVKDVERTWSYTYDFAGRRTKAVDPDVGTTVYTYNNDQPTAENFTDVARYVSQPTEPDATKIRTSYDNIGREIRVEDVTAGSTLLSQWGYDGTGAVDSNNFLGRLSSETSHTALGTFTNTIGGYDKNGNVRSITRAVAPNDGTRAVSQSESYQYQDDLLTQTTYGAIGDQGLGGLGQTVVRQEYAKYGTPTKVTATAGGATMELARASYYQWGDVRRIESGATADLNLLASTPNDTGALARTMQRSYRWDRQTGRLSQLTNSNGLGELRYEYLPNGNPSRVTLGGTGGDRASWCYTYDALHRLKIAKAGLPSTCAATSATNTADDATDIATGGNQDFTYDYLDDRLVSVVTSGNRRVDYQYNGGPHGATELVGSAGVTSNANAALNLPTPAKLVYDGFGRVREQTTYPNEDYSPRRLTEYTYNKVGTLNTTTYGATCGANLDNRAVLRFAYDTGGLRVGRRLTDDCNGASDVVYTLGTTEVTVKDQIVGARRHFASGGGRPLAVQEWDELGLNGWTWLLGDRQNTIRYVKKQTTGSGETPTYLPFGELITPSDTNLLAGQRGYLDKTVDPNGELRLDHRSFNAGLNVLTTPDPLLFAGNPQSLNPYAYAFNNPIAWTDPSGLGPEPANNPQGGPTSQTSFPTSAPTAAPVPEPESPSGADSGETFEEFAERRMEECGWCNPVEEWALRDDPYGHNCDAFCEQAEVDPNWSPNLLAEVTGVADLGRCVFRGDKSACAWTIAAGVPPLRGPKILAAAAEAAAHADDIADAARIANASGDAARSAISGSLVVSGRFPKTAGAGDILVRRGAGGEVTNYQVYAPDGLPMKRVDVTGKSHGGVDTPHVVDFERHVNPTTGEVYVRPATNVRPATPEELMGLE